jgi:hypothetical protein
VKAYVSKWNRHAAQIAEVARGSPDIRGRNIDMHFLLRTVDDRCAELLSLTDRRNKVSQILGGKLQVVPTYEYG